MSKSGCELVGCTYYQDDKCNSETNTCVCRTDEERVEELEEMVDQLKAELVKYRQGVSELTRECLEEARGTSTCYQRINKLTDGLRKIRVSDEIMEARRFAEETLKGE